MKLKQLAALLVRFIGVMFILTGLSDMLSEMLDTHKLQAIGMALGGFVLGVLILQYSRKLGEMLCKGLDNDSD